jgi:hypothetical protein
MLLLHACMHASLGWWPPLTVPLRDVLQAAHFSTVNWKALERQSAEWKLRAVMQHAFQFASSTLHAEIPAEAAAVIKSTAPSEEEDWALRAYTTDRRWDGWEARATLKAIRGIRRKARFALSLAFPSRTFVAARMGERGPISYLRRVSAALGGWMRREAR